MTKLLTGALAGQFTTGKLQPGTIEFLPPVLVCISVAELRGDTIDFSVERYATTKEAFDPFAVPVAVQCIQHAKQSAGEISGVAGDCFMDFQLPAHGAGLCHETFSGSFLRGNIDEAFELLFAAETMVHLHHQGTGSGLQGRDRVVGS